MRISTSDGPLATWWGTAFFCLTVVGMCVFFHKIKILKIKSRDSGCFGSDCSPSRPSGSDMNLSLTRVRSSRSNQLKRITESVINFPAQLHASFDFPNIVFSSF